MDQFIDVIKKDHFVCKKINNYNVNNDFRFRYGIKN